MTRLVNKRLLILLAALVLVCGGMAALSGTFASSVNYNGPETELIGDTFNVDLQYWNGKNYVSLLKGNDQPFSDSSLWCPGRSELVYLRLISEEKFPINAYLSLKVENNGFDDKLSYAVLEQDLLSASASHPTSWADFAASAKGTKVLTGNETHQLLSAEPLMTEQYLALCIHMDESATSEYQNKQLSMNFVLRMDADFMPGSEPATNP